MTIEDNDRWSEFVILQAIVCQVSRRRQPPMVQALLPAIVIIGAWELGARFAFDPRFIGQPSAILRHLLDELARGGIWADAAITFWEIMLGYVIGAIAGMTI